MSKNHRENNHKPAFADWIVLDPQGNRSLITQARFIRDDRGGYTFTDSGGVTADFPPGTVLHVMRKEPEPAPVTVGAKVESVLCPACDKYVPVEVPGPWRGDIDSMIDAAHSMARASCKGKATQHGPVILSEAAELLDSRA